MGEPAEDRGEPRHLGEDLRRAPVLELPVEIQAEPPGDARGQLAGDPPVGARLAGRREGLPHPLDAPLRVGEGALLLGERGRGEEHVRVLGRLVQEQVLDDDHVELRQRLLGVVEVGLREERVLADDVHRADPPVEPGLDHVGHREPRLGRRPDAPGPLEQGQRLGRVGLVAGQIGRDAARVAAALDVVLAAERRDAGAGPAELPGHEREVQERVGVVDAVHVLRDPHPPDQARAPPRRARVPARGARDVGGGHAGQRRRALEGRVRQ